MLYQGDYPQHLKDRVASLEGHLSNQQAEDALTVVASPRLQKLIVSHVSERNNTPELAIKHAKRGLRRAGYEEDVEVFFAKQNTPSPLISILEECVSLG